MPTLNSHRDDSGVYFIGEITGNIIRVTEACYSRLYPEFNYSPREVCLASCCSWHEEERIKEILLTAKRRGVERISHLNNGGNAKAFFGLFFELTPTHGAG